MKCAYLFWSLKFAFTVGSPTLYAIQISICQVRSYGYGGSLTTDPRASAPTTHTGREIYSVLMVVQPLFAVAALRSPSPIPPT